MSIAAPNAAVFYSEVAASLVVWAIRDSGGFPAPVNGDKKRAMPFWSSESRALKVIANVKAYEGFRPEPISWEAFAQSWIPGLTKDGILAGLNWAGPNATGYDVEPIELERNLQALINEPGAQSIIPPDVMLHNTNGLEQEFHEIKWPNEFIVQFKDGSEQAFVSDQGVYWNNGENLDGKNTNRANITCAWKKKSLTQQKYRMVEFFVDEVEQFQTVFGDIIWTP